MSPLRLETCTCECHPTLVVDWARFVNYISERSRDWRATIIILVAFTVFRFWHVVTVSMLSFNSMQIGQHRYHLWNTKGFRRIFWAAFKDYRVMSFACDHPLATADVCAYHCPLLWNTLEPSIPIYSCSAPFFIFEEAIIMCRNLLFKLLCRVWRVIGCLYIIMYSKITCT